MVKKIIAISLCSGILMANAVSIAGQQISMKVLTKDSNGFAETMRVTVVQDKAMGKFKQDFNNGFMKGFTESLKTSMLQNNCPYIAKAEKDGKIINTKVDIVDGNDKRHLTFMMNSDECHVVEM